MFIGTASLDRSPSAATPDPAFKSLPPMLLADVLNQALITIRHRVLLWERLGRVEARLLLPALTRRASTRRHANARPAYLIVACTVMTDVPEAFGPLPVALMAKVSLPLYLALVLYS